MSCSASRIVKDAGSFRDPSGQVFHWQGRVFRGLSEDTWRVVREVEEHGLLAALAEEGLIVHTSLIAPGTELHRALSQHCPEYPHFLEHARVPFVSYPYEWSTAMIADAALLQLELQCRLIREGFALKDASVYNTQFLNGRPVFIDIPSIEHAPRNDVWTAYGQFCRHFLFPLLLVHYRHIDLRGYYLCSLEGQDIETVYQVLGATSSLRPALFFDVFLQRQLQHYGERRVGELRRRLVPAAATPRKTDPRIQVFGLNRLSRKIRKLRKACVPAGHWIQYAADNSYTTRASHIKMEFVQRFLGQFRPPTVLDLGCNTGAYSRLAAAAGSLVVAADADADSVDVLYREQKDAAAHVLPLRLDIASPSPAVGYMNCERSAFLDRADFDAVFALALLHHLLIISRIPLSATASMFSALTQRWLVIEFVGRSDPMFQHLLALREDIYAEITSEHFEKGYSQHFTIIERQHIPDTDRLLYVLERNSSSTH